VLELLRIVRGTKRPSSRAMLGMLAIALLLVTVGVAGASRTDAPLPGAATTSDPYRTIRAVGFNFFREATGTPEAISYLATQLPRIKAAGFNTVSLVTPWVTFEPSAIPAVYDEQAFAYERQALQLVENYGMRAIVELPQFGEAWKPIGVDGQTWLSDPAEFLAFENFVEKFLTEIQDYASITYVMTFTESTMADTPSCDIYPVKVSWIINNCPARGGNSYAYCGIPAGKSVPSNCLAGARAHALLLRNTLGTLPGWLDSTDPALRAKFKLGIHDGRFLIANTLVPARYVYSPVAMYNGYDFLSFTNYDGRDTTMTWPSIEQHLDTQLARYHSLYPSKPLIVGEFGVSMCGPTSTEARQAELSGDFMSYSLRKLLGFSVWDWIASSGDCTTQQHSNHLALVNADGSARPVLSAVTDALTPRAQSSTLVASFSPWVVAVGGTGLSTDMRATVFDTSGAAWGTDIPVALATDGQSVSFYLPADVPPSQCNADGPCTLSATLTDPYSSLAPASFTVTLPKVSLRPAIAAATTVTSFSPWAVAVTGTDFSTTLRATLYDRDGSVWKSDLRVLVSPDYGTLTFRLPANRPPSGCNASGPCTISVKLTDTASSGSSSKFAFVLPQSP
jgi:hypothetical protein